MITKKDYPPIIIVGGGVTALFAAYQLLNTGFKIDIYERKDSPALKLLAASASGLNISTDQTIEKCASFYGKESTRFKELLTDFSLADLQSWLKDFDLSIYSGNGNKIFLKESGEELLIRLLDKLKSFKSFTLNTGFTFKAWEANKLIFETKDGPKTVMAEQCIFALGGASWPRTGSDGLWQNIFALKKINCVPFEPSNCGFETSWSQIFINKINYSYFKNIEVHFQNESKRGDLMITPYGVEGSPIYFFSREIREAIKLQDSTTIYLDLLPDRSASEITLAWNKPRNKNSISNHLRKRLGLSKNSISLINELTEKIYNPNSLQITALIKRLPLVLIKPRPIEEAISSAGGVSFSELDENLMLYKAPGFYCGGEMVDWEAPTGGFLIHGSLAMGYRIAKAIISRKI